MDDEEEVKALEAACRAVPLASGAVLDLRLFAKEIAEHLFAEGCRKRAERVEREFPERFLAVPDKLLGGWSQPCEVVDKRSEER
ncbi:hypothetical protein Srot_0078 [Segniliparus rotundus DSM 44985]|uniref:Uncharacterized protein n=1 Tax=Segniliparus rotundus (strain ATCC BAA-972 / CDC 1076 / CIP 108378 / DSM 44985 / JCM 13578) TaxID=640132 RepID=D6Z9P4_SEGRD|nr:hypothetical protein [Segniliparus rotundus]ADG96571.1 hypothetical protein Srot_0078 [Segniliparus rotundus DSM 44985]